MSTTMMLKRVTVSLQGMPPGLLMASKRIMDGYETGGAKKSGTRLSPEVEAELHCHWTLDGKKKSLAIPWTNLYKCFCQAATHFKWQKMKSFADIVAATVTCEQDFIPIGTDKYEVYQEWCRIPPKTGAMVRVARPRIRAWTCAFEMLVDDEMYGKHGVGVLRDIMTHAGRMVGLGPWRPSLRGPYGKFTVEQFAVAA